MSQILNIYITKNIPSNTSYLGRRALDHQVNFRDVQSTSCHVSGHQHLKSAIPEALQRHLSLFLRNVSVERLGTLKINQNNK